MLKILFVLTDSKLISTNIISFDQRQFINLKKNFFLILLKSIKFIDHFLNI